MSRFPNRRWLVIPTSLTGSINFGEVLESNESSLRLNLDGSETFVKYEVTVVTASYTSSWEDPDNPGTYLSSSTAAGTYGRPSIYSDSYSEYNHADILALLATEAWTSPLDEE